MDEKGGEDRGQFHQRRTRDGGKGFLRLPLLLPLAVRDPSVCGPVGKRMELPIQNNTVVATKFLDMGLKSVCHTPSGVPAAEQQPRGATRGSRGGGKGPREREQTKQCMRVRQISGMGTGCTRWNGCMRCVLLLTPSLLPVVSSRVPDSRVL